MNTAVYFLRAKQIGLTLDEMESIEEGFVYDLITEKANDAASDSYQEVATQADFDRF